MTKTKARRGAALLAAILFLGMAACKAGESQGSAGDGGDGGAGGDGSGGALACSTCADVFTNGGVPCGDTSSSEAYDALYACACGTCSAACGTNLCTSAPSNQACGQCLEDSCAAEAAECAAH
ncbi:MAG: hypothetical protein QM820_41900 [Minicystis sp.]